jgi:hypothetical protein
MTLNARRRYQVIARVCLLLSLLLGGVSAASSRTTLLEVKAFPLRGPVQNLQPQILDFRYAPYRWQTCLGLPDDPHKSIVGSDGGLYYDYGGGRFYDFKTRVLARLDAQGPKGQVSQRLHDARTPLVITEQDYGNLTLQQRAWARAPETDDVSEWSRQRVDYLWLTMVNQGREPATGRIVVQVDPKSRVVANDQRTRLVDGRDPAAAFAAMSPACERVEGTSPPGSRLLIDHTPGVLRGWARPQVPCDPRFRDILVGWARPLAFTCPAEPGKKYRVAFGLIEGYHAEAGVRPLQIRIEGQTVRDVDLVREFGRNQPVVLCFDAEDRNHNGLLEMGIYSPDGARDTNTILSALWVFDAAHAPSESALREGKADKSALAAADIDTLASQSNTMQLAFPERTLAPGQTEQVLLTFYQDRDTSAPTSAAEAQREYDRAIQYWRQVDLPYSRMVVPDEKVQALLDSCIRNIYQAREIKNGHPAFQVGPTCYRGTWAADGPFILEAITYLGRANETRAGLEQQVDQDQGPGGVEFSKKSGLRLWMIWRHAQLTGDWDWLRTMWPRVEREVNQIIAYRRATMNDPNQANYGLMPIGFGDGGLGGKHREYTNVYWTLAGLKAALDMAAKLDKPQATTWQAQYKDYWRYFERARNRDKVTDSFGNTYVPVTMKGEAPQLPQRGAWAFLQSIFPGRIFDANDALMLGTMAMLDAHEKEGLIHGTGWLADGIWNYAASFYGHAHLWLGHGRKAAATLYAFGNHAGPLLCWREEQNLTGASEEYCGDMPHNWASAEFIRLIRHCLILERDQELHLLEGLPTTWTQPGRTTRLTQIPTSFGPVSLTLEVAATGKTARLTCDPPQRDPVSAVVVHLENFARPVRGVKLAGGDLNESPPTVPTDRPFTLDLTLTD